MMLTTFGASPTSARWLPREHAALFSPARVHGQRGRIRFATSEAQSKRPACCSKIDYQPYGVVLRLCLDLLEITPASVARQRNEGSRGQGLSLEP